MHEHKRSIYVDREGVKIIFDYMTPCFALKNFVLFLLFCFIASATLVVHVGNVVRLGLYHRVHSRELDTLSLKSSTLNKTQNTTLCGGSLGSRVDEERSKLRELM